MDRWKTSHEIFMFEILNFWAFFFIWLDQNLMFENSANIGRSLFSVDLDDQIELKLSQVCYFMYMLDHTKCGYRSLTISNRFTHALSSSKVAVKVFCGLKLLLTSNVNFVIFSTLPWETFSPSPLFKHYQAKMSNNFLWIIRLHSIWQEW